MKDLEVLQRLQRQEGLLLPALLETLQAQS